MSSKVIHYVSIIAIDPRADEVLLMEKTKGPQHLIGKLTFPGGKREAEDPSAAHAAARELLEEAGVEVPPFDLIHLSKKGGQDHTWEIFVAITDLSDAQAQPGEEEAVFKASLSETRKNATDLNTYAADTAELLESMFSVRQIQRRLNSAASKSPALR
jgi:8-oxo-dGTP pyrophosphatase MutT (NUDIX family)